MKLHEYQARDILAKYGIPVTGGGVASTPAEARAVAEQIGGKVVVKAQVFVGGRGKAGGVKLADTPEQAEQVAGQILGMNIKGLTVEKVLVAEAISYEREIYLGVVMDRGSKRIVVMASAEGGVEIEEVAKTNPEAIVKIAAHPTLGLQPYQARELAFGIGLTDGKQARQFAQIATALYRVYMETDASLAEINPLVVLPGGALQALELEDRAGRLGAVPPRRPGGDARRLRRAGGRAARTRGRHHVYQARRQHRLHGQRRRPGHGHDGRGQAVWRRAGQLPRYRRRRGQGQGQGRAADHPVRPERARR